jgi:dipeptidyl aminopeptidase/acylaminoacyl peptidase
MLRSRWIKLFLLLTLLVTVVPLPALADDQTVVDRGQNVYDVDDNAGEINNLLPGDDVQTIAEMQNYFQSALTPLSPISPDDGAFFALQDGSVGFVDVQTGELTAFDLQTMFGRYIPLAIIDSTLWSWPDDRTLSSWGIDIRTFDIVIVNIDRFTGEVSGLPFPIGNLLESGALPVSPSPDGSRYLMLFLPLLEELLEEERKPYYVALQSTLATENRMLAQEGRLVGPLYDYYMAKLNAIPAAKKLLEAARMLSPTGSDINLTTIELELKIYDVASGEITDLLNIPLGTAFVAPPVWSQDSSKLALSHIFQPDFTFPLTYRGFAGQGALISEELYRDLTGNLPPSQNPWLQSNMVDVFDLNKNERQTMQAAEGDGTMRAAVGFSTDSKTLLVQAGYPTRLAGRTHPVYFPVYRERAEYRLYDEEMNEIRRMNVPELTTGDSQFTSATFVSPDEILFRPLVGTDLPIYYYNMVSGELRRITTKPGTYSSIRPTRQSREVLYLYQDFVTPPDLYRMRWDGTAVTRLSFVFEEWSARTNLSVHSVSFRMPNGQTRTGLLSLPAGVSFPPKNIPIVVWQEGGPTLGMPNFFGAEVERPFALLPAFGFGLLSVPSVGRLGFGVEQYRGLYNNNNYGAADIDEQAEMTRQMIQRGWTSRGKVGIVGCSYGGYFVVQSLVRHPDLYAAGNAQCAAIDYLANWTQGASFPVPVFTQGLPPYAALDEYRRDSPAYNASRIRSPLLTFHGTRDFLPIVLNQNLHHQVVNNGVPAKMLRFVGEGHGLGSPNNQLYAAQEQILWFRQYLR